MTRTKLDKLLRNLVDRVPPGTLWYSHICKQRMLWIAWVNAKTGITFDFTDYHYKACPQIPRKHVQCNYEALPI